MKSHQYSTRSFDAFDVKSGDDLSDSPITTFKMVYGCYCMRVPSVTQFIKLSEQEKSSPF